MEINIRKGSRDIGFSLGESSYHDKWYLMLRCYKKTVEIELGDCKVDNMSKEKKYGIMYDVSDKSLHTWFHKYRKCFLFGN